MDYASCLLPPLDLDWKIQDCRHGINRQELSGSNFPQSSLPSPSAIRLHLSSETSKFKITCRNLNKDKAVTYVHMLKLEEYKDHTDVQVPECERDGLVPRTAF